MSNTWIVRYVVLLIFKLPRHKSNVGLDNYRVTFQMIPRAWYYICIMRSICQKREPRNTPPLLHINASGKSEFGLVLCTIEIYQFALRIRILRRSMRSKRQWPKWCRVQILSSPSSPHIIDSTLLVFLIIFDACTCDAFTSTARKAELCLSNINTILAELEIEMLRAFRSYPKTTMYWRE